MATAVAAKDFHPAAISICMLVNGTRDLIIKTGPSASGRKLVFGAVQRLVALPADIGARCFVPVIFTTEGTFGAFVEDDAGFFGSKLVVWHDSNED